MILILFNYYSWKSKKTIFITYFFLHFNYFLKYSLFKTQFVIYHSKHSKKLEDSDSFISPSLSLSIPHSNIISSSSYSSSGYSCSKKFYLHKGQLGFILSQSSTHSTWKWWLHGSSLRCSCTLKSDKQIAQVLMSSKISKHTLIFANIQNNPILKKYLQSN